MATRQPSFPKASASQFSKAITEAKVETAKLANYTRDKDLGPVGFDSNAQRKGEFAANVGL